MTTGPYDQEFFSARQASAKMGAQTVVPLVNDWIAPSSVVDLGCGTGTWLAVFRDLGVGDVRGVDGDYVERDMLEIPANRFSAHDLQTKFQTDKRFDLAMSLEVAEHLPEESASTLVESLVNLAPVVLFSAAIPHQGGVHHINCQWPAYWAELFESHGFVAIDCLRSQLWENADVEWWYRQNILIYISENVLNNYPQLAVLKQSCPSPPPSLVHPMLLQWWVDWGMSQSKLYWDSELKKTGS